MNMIQHFPHRPVKKNGFTMIELLVVATIMIVLTTIGFVSYRAASMKSRNSKRQSDLETVRQALVLYRSEEGEYPPSSTYSFPQLVVHLQTLGYLGQGTSFVDPKTGGSYTYSSNSTTFSLSAVLEPNGNLYQVTNP